MRLYDEFVDKARDRVAGVYHHGENNAVRWTVVCDEWKRDTTVYVTINGERYDISLGDRMLFASANPHEQAVAVRGAIAGKLAALMTIDVVGRAARS